MAIKDISGRRFGRLFALRPVGRNDRNGSAMWFCLCNCGGQLVANGASLRYGSVQSCGCLFKESCDRRWEKYKSRQKLIGAKLNQLGIPIKEIGFREDFEKESQLSEHEMSQMVGREISATNTSRSWSI